MGIDAPPDAFEADARALITGGGRGIGRAVGRRLAASGVHVILAGRNAQDVQGAAEVIRRDGGRAEAVDLDVTDLRASAGVVESFRPNILVNNAGLNRPKPLIEVTADDFDTVMAVNVRAAFFLAQAVSRRLIQAGRPGSLVHLGSQMGHVGAPDRSIYCTSKWGLEGLNKALAVELGPFQIRSNIVAPTFVETELTKGQLADETFRRSVLSKIKLGRLATAEDVARAVVFLASNAALMITGTSMLVDGGWTAE
jgi:NAD(P)-dependent dehydrogenase (short-subunit alcohol dehydrogenase family)